MKKVFLSILFFLLNSTAYADVSSPTDLSNQYRSAHQSNDYSNISKLINWDGVRKPMKKKIEVYTTATFDLDIKDISIEEVNNKFKEVELGKKKVKPNLEVTHIMKVRFDTDINSSDTTDKDTAVYLLGKKDEQYMIAVYIKDKSAPHHH